MEEITIMQGDQYAVPFAITGRNGDPVTAEDISALEVVIGTLRKTTPEVTYNAETGMWDFPLTQAESFALEAKPEKAQLRVKFPDGSVIGTNAGLVLVVPSASREVL